MKILLQTIYIYDKDKESVEVKKTPKTPKKKKK